MTVNTDRSSCSAVLSCIGIGLAVCTTPTNAFLYTCWGHSSSSSSNISININHSGYTRRHRQPPHSHRRPKVADASSEWPPKDLLPTWSDVLCAIPTTKKNDSESNTVIPLYLDENNEWTVEVTNDAPTWEQVLARALPIGTVEPASAILAPKGGCDNLCNDEERYTDSCVFRVRPQFDNMVETPVHNESEPGHSLWLRIGTEERQWTYQLMSKPPSRVMAYNQ